MVWVQLSWVEWGRAVWKKEKKDKRGNRDKFSTHNIKIKGLVSTISLVRVQHGSGYVHIFLNNHCTFG